MQNPFKKRATEFIEDAASFVSITSSLPLKLFFEGYSTELFDRLVTVVGSPGSGKTTLARLMDIETLFKLLTLSSPNSKSLRSALVEYQIIDNSYPRFLSYRLPSSSNLRDIWELPYSEKLRSMLLRSFIQAKAILGWMRKLEKVGINIANIHIIAKEGSEAQSNLLHADNAIEFRQYAREVEEGILRAITSLLPPSEEELLGTILYSPFNAFDVIELFSIPNSSEQDSDAFLLKPMLIIDDAHELHPNQFQDLTQWLKNREMKITRWLMTRIDAIAHQDFRIALMAADNDKPTPGTTLGRDYIFINLQYTNIDRKKFRSIAKDISQQYIQQMPSFSRKGVKALSDCLSSNPQPISKTDLGKLQTSVTQLLTEIRLPEYKIKKIQDLIPANLSKDQFLATFRILLNREKKRSPQNDIFAFTVESSDGTSALEPAETEEDMKEISAIKSALVRGAEIQLMHEYDRPFFFTFDRLADASNNNIEQFIYLAGALVDGLETKLLRGKSAELDAKEQHQFLIERATQAIKEWDFPNCDSVRKLILFIAKKCIERTLEPNAPLNDGANAFGIPQQEMNELQVKAPALVFVLHFALAYNALSLKESYECKNKTWCLFVLTGLPCIAHKLTLNHGGFCEGHLSDLVEAINQ